MTENKTFHAQVDILPLQLLVAWLSNDFLILGPHKPIVLLMHILNFSVFDFIILPLRVTPCLNSGAWIRWRKITYIMPTICFGS